MDNEAMGDEVYQPTGSDTRGTHDNPDDIDMENALDEPDLDATLDQGYSPPEKPFVVDDRQGTTAREQREGESLDQRLAEEVPDVGVPPGDGIGDQPGANGEPVDPEAGGARAGRIVGTDEGTPRGNGGVVARDVGIDGGAAGAEEAAVHIVDDEDLDTGSPRE
ncbi:DUF5709 domain-containing protein [Streptomyces sp. MST-110588]|uniref:DUF5709 domain-containing protein n=1 Tax=Streptomyces sp. MST-110588 TaxID=2833628 RepID=UPI001F5CB24D|nr:DUF5709 domain-containing protein [Streptomyces sp. MST-110588]UNO43815.1 hypothetical protein KGS77_09775 [Streptomyces sp. MST-110588]